jgi:large subunit ribosomal protein L7/L12
VSENYDGYALQARVAELERKVEYLMQRVAGAPAAPTGGAGQAADVYSPAVLEFMRQGKKIQAIKQYRQETGVGLAEAKHAIDALG